ncbi:uncharacterized protein V2V93DRAFT_362079 [Kockiozyma suomiensis]|uniref:uncharacterized protein n=1 Tax=Kockiozyma suomiensis TaxID=1337062 RepID=UPI003343064B
MSSSSDDDDTDTRLAVLASLCSGSLSAEVLLEALVAAGGDVNAAAAAFLGQDNSHRQEQTKQTKRSQRPLQAAVTQFFSSVPHKRAHSEGSAASVYARGVVHLYTPRMIADRTPCTFTPNFLSADLAEILLSELTKEASTWTANQFRLFNREVSSPHTTAFYVSKTRIGGGEKFAHTYRYNGAPISDVRPFTNTMELVKAKVEELVARELASRPRQQYQTPDRWSAEVAFCNNYAGAHEGVGYHADRLTYHGPQPVIASLSLGATREFRLREASPTANTPTYALHLPHNSLLVMHAPCQEQYKHTVMRARCVEPHPVSGNARINITFRMYRPEYAPDKCPTCRCGMTMILRCVSKQQESKGKYFWSCGATYQQETGCDLFLWQPVTDDGLPVPLPTYNYSTDKASATATTATSSAPRPQN